MVEQLVLGRHNKEHTEKKHILIDCPNYQHIRAKYFTSHNLHELFSSIHPLCIVDFLKEINLYDAF